MKRKDEGGEAPHLLFSQAHPREEQLPQHDSLCDVRVGVEAVTVQGAGQAGLADALATDDAGLEEGGVDLQARGNLD